MNVSELARRVNLPPQELYELLPRYGFDVGRRAIKIDDRLAQQFLKQWPRIRRELQRQREKAREEEVRKQRREAVTTGTAREVAIPSRIAVRDFAALLQLPVSEVLQELLRNGILAHLNEPIDYATAAIIAEDLGWKAAPQTTDAVADAIAQARRTPADVSARTSADSEAGGQAAKLTPTGGTTTMRPPVVVVMGHVDHGKTSLLDAIRSTNVAGGEAGGITQHIGAYQTTVSPNGEPSSRGAERRGTPGELGGRTITFIDTPGHEAFTTMRSRGARVADIAVLVVAADDGVQPQTKEALKIIQAAGIPFVVAVNKVDKPDADPDRVMQELGALGVASEAWGGKVPFARVSAKARTGIDDLMEVILLVADVESDRLRASADGAAKTVTIESHVAKGEGPVATLLVQQGTLHVGDMLAVGTTLGGKVRAMHDHTGAALTEAIPSTPVRILGFKTVPEVGDVVTVVADARGLEKAKKATHAPAPMSVGRGGARVYPERVRESNGSPPASGTGEATTTDGDQPAIVLPVVLRADVLGSLEAFASEIEKIGSAAARVQIVARGLGNITESDVQQAAACGAQIFGFGVRIPDPIARHAREAKVPVTTHKIIYELLKQVRVALEAKIPEETTREDLGTLSVLALFRKGQQWHVVGGRVTTGSMVMDPNVRVVRDRDGAEGKLMALQAGKEEVREVVEGQECGMKIGGIPELTVGDVLKFVRVEVRKKHL